MNENDLRNEFLAAVIEESPVKNAGSDVKSIGISYRFENDPNYLNFSFTSSLFTYNMWPAPLPFKMDIEDKLRKIIEKFAPEVLENIDEEITYYGVISFILFRSKSDPSKWELSEEGIEVFIEQTETVTVAETYHL